MTNKKKLKELQKIIDKYIKILKVLPTGGEISEEEAKRIGIPKELKSYIDRAYKSGKLKAYTRVRISVKETEDHFERLTTQDTDYVKLLFQDSMQDITNVLERHKTQITRAAIEVLKREMRVTEELLGDTDEMTSRQMASDLRRITKDVKQDWDMVVRTEMVNAQQEAMANAILQGKSPYSDAKGDTIVYKQPSPNACPHCKRLYLEKDGTPKLFKLSRLIANGTNVGRKAKDWKATLGVVHPHCQCQLLIMPKGCKFDENGRIIIDKTVVKDE